MTMKYKYVFTNRKNVIHTLGTQVILYIREEYKYKIKINDACDQNVLLLAVQMMSNAYKYITGGLYHSANASHGIFLMKLETSIDNILNNNTGNWKIILHGDFNKNVNRVTYYCDKLQELVNLCRMYKVVEDFTRITHNSKIIIVKCSNVMLAPRITDHALLD